MPQVIQGNFRKEISTERRNVPDRRINDAKRGRRHLLDYEIQDICKTIRKHSRNPVRDNLMVLLTYRHGLRVSELLALQWQHVNLKDMSIRVNRRKNGISNTQPISCPDELRLLRRLHKEQSKPLRGFLFISERGSPISIDGFRKMFSKMSLKATGTQWNCHALRHSTATEQLNKGRDIRTVQLLMGHRNIQNTTVYHHETTKLLDNIAW